MHITLRKEAIAQGSSQYYTGKPCRNGHTTYRYTTSGTCSACVAAATAKNREEISLAAQPLEVRAAPRPYERRSREDLYERRAIVAEDLAEIRLRAYIGSDAQLLVKLASSLCLAKYPQLTSSDVAVRAPISGRVSGTALYRVKCPVESVAFLQETAAVLLRNHRVDLRPFHERQLQQALASVPVEPLPEWTFQ